MVKYILLAICFCVGAGWFGFADMLTDTTITTQIAANLEGAESEPDNPYYMPLCVTLYSGAILLLHHD